MKKYVWNAAITADEFYKRLDAATIPDNPYSASLATSDDYLLQKNKMKFCLRSNRMVLRNPFERRLFGQVEKTQAGVKITARMRIIPMVALISALWFCAMLFFNVLTILLLINYPSDESVWLTVCSLLILVLGSAFLVVFRGKPGHFLSIISRVTESEYTVES